MGYWLTGERAVMDTAWAAGPAAVVGPHLLVAAEPGEQPGEQQSIHYEGADVAMGQFNLGVAISEEVLGERSPVVFQSGVLEGMQEASDLGFGSVELHVRDPHSLDARTIRRHAQDLGLRVSAIGTGLENVLNGHCLTHDDPARRFDAREAMMRHIDFAAELDSVVIIGLIRGDAGQIARVPDKLKILADELRPLAAAAQEAGVATGLEPMAYYCSDMLNTARETTRFLEENDLGSMGIMLDTHHMFLQDPGAGQAILEVGPRLTHVHASDSNRRYPGAGNVDFHEVCQALTAIGYNGSLSLEVLPWPDPATAASRGLAELQRCVESVTAKAEA